MIEALTLQDNEFLKTKIKGIYVLPSTKVMLVNKSGVAIEFLVIEKTFRLQLANIDRDVKAKNTVDDIKLLEQPELFSVRVKDEGIEDLTLKAKSFFPNSQHILQNNTGVNLKIVSKLGCLIIQKDTEGYPD